VREARLNFCLLIQNFQFSVRMLWIWIVMLCFKLISHENFRFWNWGFVLVLNFMISEIWFWLMNWLWPIEWHFVISIEWYMLFRIESFKSKCMMLIRIHKMSYWNVESYACGLHTSWASLFLAKRWLKSSLTHIQGKSSCWTSKVSQSESQTWVW